MKFIHTKDMLKREGVKSFEEIVSRDILLGREEFVQCGKIGTNSKSVINIVGACELCLSFKQFY